MAKKFTTLADMEGREHEENVGIKVAWPDMEGATITIAHAGLIPAVMSRLEAEFRAQRGIKPEDPLPEHDPVLAPSKPEPGAELITVEEYLLRQSLFGSAVQSFEIPDGAGGLMPVNRESFNRLVKLRRFRRFVLNTARDMESAKAVTLEGEAKN